MMFSTIRELEIYWSDGEPSTTAAKAVITPVGVLCYNGKLGRSLHPWHAIEYVEWASKPADDI